MVVLVDSVRKATVLVDSARPEAAPVAAARRRIGQILPGFMHQHLNLTDEQQKQVASLQKEVDAKLAKILSAEQNEQLKQMQQRGPGGGPPGFGGPGGGRRSSRRSRRWYLQAVPAEASPAAPLPTVTDFRLLRLPTK